MYCNYCQSFQRTVYKLRFEILKRDNFTCQYCGKSQKDGATLHVDHIKPFSKGGRTIPENLVTACFECNIGKSDNPLDEKLLANRNESFK